MLSSPGTQGLVQPLSLLVAEVSCLRRPKKASDICKEDKANNDQSLTLVRAIMLCKPTTATFENVEGMWRRKHKHYLKTIVRDLIKLGYQVRVRVLRACDYGDPQTRKRLIIFASHNSAPIPIIPPITHGEPSHGSQLLPFAMVKDAIDDLSAIDPDNDNVQVQNMQGRSTTLRPGQHGLVRVQANGLAPAIRASSLPPFHYNEDRCLNVRECASLQGFPRDFVIEGETIKDQYRQVGNAVPIRLATAIAQAVKSILYYNYEQY